MFPHQNSVCTSLPKRATCLDHLFLHDFITRTKVGKDYRSLSSSLCSFHHSPVISSLLDPNTFLSTLFSNALSLRSSLNVSDQVLYPHETVSKIIVLYILIYFWVTNWKTKDSASNDRKRSLTSICS
jgi:hypothetical protein